MLHLESIKLQILDRAEHSLYFKLLRLTLLGGWSRPSCIFEPGFWDDRSLHASLFVNRPAIALLMANIQPMWTFYIPKPWARVQLTTWDRVVGPR